jgi:hypothetical protein
MTRWRAAVAAAVAIVAMFGWRASVVPMPGQAAAANSGGVAIPALPSVNDAAIVAGTGQWSAFRSGKNVLTVEGLRFSNSSGFKLHTRASDFLLVPLRPLPPHPGMLTVDEGVHVEPGIPVVKAHQTITFGLPCAFGLAGSTVCGTLGSPLISSR